MQFLLHTDPHTDGSHPMAEHLETVVKAALGRFGERITRVEAHLSDANSQSRTATGTVQCTLDARLMGLDAVIVTQQAETAHQAIDAGVRTLKRAVGAAIAKHDPRQRRHGATVAPAGLPESTGSLDEPTGSQP